jgi:predicted NBD/HSP70 family sugar kinase
MLQWLNKLIRKNLSMDARALATLAVLSFLGAVAWWQFAKPATGGVQIGTGAVEVWIPPVVLAFFALVLLLLAAYYSVAHKVTEEVGQVAHKVAKIEEQLIVQTPFPKGYHVGCRIGRRRLECGVLYVDETASGLPRKLAHAEPWIDDAGRHGEFLDGALLRHAKHGLFQGTNLYHTVVEAIAELFSAADRNHKNIASIGIAVPGGVHPALGTFEGIVEGVPFENNEDITGRVARLLLEQLGDQIVGRVFGTSDPEVMRDRIHLDNDARCAARWLLVEKDSWKDFVCVFAGSGLGSGLVFNREVFYGNRFRAGEVGHVNLNLGSRLLLDDGGTGWPLQARQCSCGKRGYHFESLVGIGGLGHLAQVIDGDMLAQLRAAYGADAERGEQLKASSIDDADADGMMVLRTLASVAQPVPHIPEMHDPIFVERILPDESFLKLIRDDPMGDYLALVGRHYARMFSTGIAALLDALDVGHIALCGTIPEFLQHNHEFVTALQRNLPYEIPGMQRNIILNYGSMLRWGWRGAALLPRDPSYRNRRF